jgi:methionyl-tRNA formyltransferase
VASTAVVFAYHDVGVRCLRVLLEADVDVRLVVTHRDDPNELIFFGNVAELARSHALDTLVDPEPAPLFSAIERISPDFIFSFYYRRMLPAALLKLARRGAFNMHGSLLPKYRGRAPVNWAVLHGETETGATLHEMVEKPDAGRIVDQEAVPIGPEETAAEVFGKVTDAAEAVLRRSIQKMLDGKIELRAQDLSAGSYFGARKPEDGRIDWSRSALEIHNLVRAVAPPYPGAFSGDLKIFRTRLEADRKPSIAKPGPYREGGEWFAVCGDGKVLRLLEVQESP